MFICKTIETNSSSAALKQRRERRQLLSRIPGSKQILAIAVLVAIVVSLSITTLAGSFGPDGHRKGRSKGKGRSKKTRVVKVVRLSPVEGALFEQQDGTNLLAVNTDKQFNPASTVKLMLSYMALKKLGAQYELDNSIPTVKGSEKLVSVLKRMLCYSNNYMAEALGAKLGGPAKLREFLIEELSLSPDNIRLASTSGLGINRVTPAAMMKILRALEEQLQTEQLEMKDIMAVAAVDAGTLLGRFDNSPYEGRVVAKTGTLVHTDQGASALVGELHTVKEEPVLFVIFQLHGNVGTFRQRQEDLVESVGSLMGGPSHCPVLTEALLPPIAK